MYLWAFNLGGGWLTKIVCACACQTSKTRPSLYQFFTQLPTHQFNIFNRKAPISDSTWANEADVCIHCFELWGKCVQGENLSNLQYFCQMIIGICSIKLLTQFILTTEGKNVLETFFYICTIDLLGKSIIQLAIPQNKLFGIWLYSEIEIIITFEWNMV